MNYYNTLETTQMWPTGLVHRLKTANTFIYTANQRPTYDQLNHASTNNKWTSFKTFKNTPSLQSYYFFFFTRLTFRGKSYRLRSFSTKKKFIMNFGYSHWTRLYLSNSWLIGKRKKKKDRDRARFIIVTQRYLHFKKVKNFLPFVRSFNPYTYRGLRLRKQFIIRRPGKINQHISILH